MKNHFIFLLIAIFFVAGLKAQSGIKPVTDTSKAGRANDRLRTAGPKDGWGNTNNNDTLSPKTQAAFKRIAAKYHTGQVEYHSVENELRKSGIDFSKLPIEDAVMMMFMLIADDARKDMREILEEINAARQKKAALRQAEELLKSQIDSLRDQARNKYRTDSLVVKKKLNEKTIQLQQYYNLEKEAMAIENKATEDKTATEKHLQSVEEAISKLKKNQSGRKSQ